MGIRLLVTGGCGFIGSRFVRRALQLNYSVMNIDKLTYAADEGFNKLFYSLGDYKFNSADICDTNKFINILDTFEPTVIVHFAAESHVDRSIHGPSDFVQTNILGTFSILEAIRSYIRSRLIPVDLDLVHVSTDEVYGALGPIGSFNEQSPYSPNSPYSASKASSDLLVNAWSKTYGINSVVTNCSNNYGPHQNKEKLIPKIILNALNLEPIPIYGDGANIRDWLFVDDHVEALLKIISSPHKSERYNIGGGYEITNFDLANLICDIIDEQSPHSFRRKELISFVEDRAAHDFRYSIDNSKIRFEIDWEPTTNFSDGLYQTIDWFRNKATEEHE